MLFVRAAPGAQEYGKTRAYGRRDPADAGEPAVSAKGLFGRPAERLPDIVASIPAIGRVLERSHERPGGDIGVFASEHGKRGMPHHKLGDPDRVFGLR